MSERFSELLAALRDGPRVAEEIEALGEDAKPEQAIDRPVVDLRDRLNRWLERPFT